MKIDGRPRLTRYYRGDEVGETKPEWLFRYVEGDIGRDRERIGILLYEWYVWDDEMCRIAGDDIQDRSDLQALCDQIDQIASKWYEIPGMTAQSVGRYVSQSKLTTHCQRCRLELVFDGRHGMACPVHGWDYK